MNLKNGKSGKSDNVSRVVISGGLIIIIILLAILFLALSNVLSTSPKSVVLDAVLLFLAIIFGNFAYDLLKDFYKTIIEMTQKKQSETK